MAIYKTTITPNSNFATPLMGDTLFGQICWAISFKFGEDKLKELLSNYEENPFLIVSDGFASGYLPKPTMPMKYLNEDESLKKENCKKIWLTILELQKGQFEKAKTNKDIDNIEKDGVIIRNHLNYKTFLTGNGFDPYGERELSFSKKDIYFYIGDNFSVNDLEKVLKLISEMGYGKDTTIGKGRFEFSTLEKVNWQKESSSFMSLSVFTPFKLDVKEIFYEPFTRFGKTGLSRANTNPFKNPILLAKSGAVIVFNEKKSLFYVGKGIKNISTYKDIVHQGYSIVIPIKDIKC